MGDLKITILDAPQKTSDCGGARSRVKWSVEGKSGWIIQHVVWNKNRKDCSGRKLEPIGFTGEYWEAWKVTAGKVMIGDTDQEHQSDTFQIADQGNATKGDAKIIGEVKFIENYDLRMPPWEKDRVPSAGALPTTSKAPPKWNIDNTEPHTLESKWVCCEDKAENKVTGAPMPEEKKENTKTPSPVKNVLKSLRSMPAWSELRADDRQGRQALEHIVQSLVKTKLDVIRSGMELYIQLSREAPGQFDIPEMSRLFVLNRFLFDVPAEAPLGSIRLFGGWDGIVVRPGVISPLWPWRVVRGRKQLVGVFSGYAGDEYLALQEFDYFRERFAAAAKVPKAG
jgi:hypothetical protein